MFTKKEREMIIIALQMRRNFIQTGTVYLTPQDVENMGSISAKETGAKVHELCDSQMELCADTETLITKLTDM